VFRADIPATGGLSTGPKSIEMGNSRIWSEKCGERRFAGRAPHLGSIARRAGPSAARSDDGTVVDVDIRSDINTD
jgi:hypothetical protein